MIRFLLFLLFLLSAFTQAAEPTVVTISPEQVRQEFQGMGCGAIFYEAHVTSLGKNGRAEEQEKLYDDIFSKVRTDFLQLQIRWGHEPKNDNDDPYVQNFDPKDFAYCEHPLEISAAAKKRNSNMKLYAVLYTPPPWMKTNNDAGGGGKTKATVKPGLELEVGEYVWAFLAHMQKHGQPIDYLSISNEADWGHDQPGYFLTTEQHTQLFVKIAEYLDEMSRRHPEVPSPKLVAPNMLSAVDTANHSLPALLAAAADQVDVVGNHDYDRRGHRWAKMREVAGDKPLWMTEACFNGVDKSPGLINSAGEFWLYMTEAFNEGVNVWMAYDWVYPPRQGGEALIHLNWGKSYYHTKIYHGFRQWCAPLVPGMRIVDSKVSGEFASDIAKPGVKASSFISSDKTKLVVHVAAVQDQDAEIEIRIAPPFADAPFRMWRTGRDEDFAELPSGRAKNGLISTRLPGRGLLTISLEKSNETGARSPDPVQVVLLAGQSNMDGNVPITALPPEFKQPPTNVSLIDRGQPAWIAGGKFFGPEVAFAATVAAARPGDDFLLVKRAMGGTSLAGWAPQWDQSRLTSKYDTAAGPLYRKLLDEHAKAIKGRPARLTGVLWMQGESDTRYPALGPNYFENFKTLIAAFRRDLNAPELPFFFGRVNMPTDATEEDRKTIKFPYIQQVRAAQERAAREIPNVFLVETDDLGKQADRIHYDAAGQIALGRRFAEAWLKTVPQEPKIPPTEVLSVAGRPAFLIPAKTAVAGKPKPWVWYAPTLPRLPGAEERWMFKKFREAGIAIAGIDVGESYGSPAGRELFSRFHAEMTENRGYSRKPVMLARSRGGLMHLSWASENPDKVAAFAGIYPVCNIASYPGAVKAAAAYQMTPENLQKGLATQNPIDRLASLAKVGVPFFAIHGGRDKVVPLEDNSALLKSRYESLGGSMQLIVPPGQGHNLWQGFFQCQELLDFVITHAKL